MYTLSKNMMLSLKQISFLYRNICSIANTKYFLAQCLFLILKILLAIYIHISLDIYHYFAILWSALPLLFNNYSIHIAE